MKAMIHLPSALEKITNHYSPKIIGEVNDTYVKIVKILGDKVPWHNHEHEDELFYILEGSLIMEIENETPFEMTKGDLYIVKQGVNHKVSAAEECHILLIENKSALHTGKVTSEITKSIEEQQK